MCGLFNTCACDQRGFFWVVNWKMFTLLTLLCDFYHQSGLFCDCHLMKNTMWGIFHVHTSDQRGLFSFKLEKVHLNDFSTGVPSSEWTFCLSINEKVQCRDLMCALVVVWCSVLFNVKLMIISKYLHCRYPNLLC